MAGPADLIVMGGPIHTADGASPSPHAFAAAGGRFISVGSLDDAMALRGPATRLLDLRGASVLPGLVDAHLHLTNLGLALAQVDLRETRSFEEVVDRTAAFARIAGDGWILGRGWDQNRWRDRSFPSHEALSAAIPHRPVALSRIDGHAVLVNARAMAVCGVDAAAPDPPGGRILRDRGAPTGVFIDAAQARIFSRVPTPTHAALAAALRAAIAQCNRWGITAVAEPGCDDDVLAAHAALLAGGEYSIRTYAMLHDAPSLIEAHARGGIVDAAYGGRLWVRAIKMYADGALGSRGAALLEPYSDDPANAGLILTSRQRVEEVTESALRSGFQVCVHAIGDRANRMVLDAYQTALERAAPSTDPRLRIEHAQVIAPGDVPRFAALRVIASMQATHARSDMPWTTARLGLDRLGRAYAWRALLDSRATVANGTDAPVEPVDPRRTFAASIVQHGATVRPMTRREALASMTIRAAYANFQERHIGSIAPGKYADFVVMDRNWMTASLREIERTTIVATYFSGRPVYAARGRPQAARSTGAP